MAKKNGILIAALAGAAILFLAFKKNANVDYNLQSLNDRFGADNVARLQKLLNVLAQSKYGLTQLQIYLLLSQALHETGLFTGSPNYTAIDSRNNWAGLSYGGQYNVYSNLDSFVSDWLSPTYLAKDKGAGYPLDATNPQDYAHRLKVNGYYTDAEGTYANGLTTWYNLLTGL